MEYVLKRIHPDGIDAALEKADKYRELNQPEEAESICLDVLAIRPDHQLALRILGLARTDQFGPSTGAKFAAAEDAFAQLTDPYERAYYAGLSCERQAKAQLAGQLSLQAVTPLFDQALARYAEAERLRPPGNDDATLRWNSCVRTLQALRKGAVTDDVVEDDWDTDFVRHTP